MTGFRYDQLPRKRMAAGALFFDGRGRLLVVKPTYRPDDWYSIPGGVVEADESPKAGCAREVREELGLEVPLGRLLAVDYRPQEKQVTESLQFVFAGGVLPPALIERICLPADELSEYRFVAPEEALPLLSPHLRRRVEAALEAASAESTVYLEGGQRA
jgi:8-oxo-dGTP diphosphatase